MKEFNRRDVLKLAGLAVGTLALSPLMPLKDVPGGSEVNRLSSDVLDLPTQEAIAARAESLIRLTPDTADAEADVLKDGVKYSSAGNICGPLSAYPILGTVIEGYTLYDFWEAKSSFCAKVFSADRFDDIFVKQPIADFDFGSINLQPGDFLYFYPGKKNSWEEHMMLISRRDKDGVLWSVTNYPGNDIRFIIQEVPFWNPGNPDASFVKQLALGRNHALFSTGQKGFDLWRLKAGQPTAYDSENIFYELGRFFRMR